jgi:hypothetical protein
MFLFSHPTRRINPIAKYQVKLYGYDNSTKGSFAGFSAFVSWIRNACVDFEVIDFSYSPPESLHKSLHTEKGDPSESP